MAAVGQPDMTAENERFANNAARCREVDVIMGEGGCKGVRPIKWIPGKIRASSFV